MHYNSCTVQIDHIPYGGAFRHRRLLPWPDAEQNALAFFHAQTLIPMPTLQQNALLSMADCSDWQLFCMADCSDWQNRTRVFYFLAPTRQCSSSLYTRCRCLVSHALLFGSAHTACSVAFGGECDWHCCFRW